MQGKTKIKYKKYYQGTEGTQLFDPNAKTDMSYIGDISNRYANQRTMVGQFANKAADVAGNVIGLIKDAKGLEGQRGLTDIIGSIIPKGKKSLAPVTQEKTGNKSLKLKSTKKYKAGINALVDPLANLTDAGGDAITSSAQNADGTISEGGAMAGSSMRYAGTGAKIGANFGPQGALIGAGIGAVGGLIGGALNAKAQNKAIKEAKKRAEGFAAFQRTNGRAQGLDTTKNMAAKDGLKKLKVKPQFEVEKDAKIKDIQTNSNYSTLKNKGVKDNYNPKKLYENYKERTKDVEKVNSSKIKPGSLNKGTAGVNIFKGKNNSITISNGHLLSPNKKEIDDTIQHEYAHSTQEKDYVQKSKFLKYKDSPVEKEVRDDAAKIVNKRKYEKGSKDIKIPLKSMIKEHEDLTKVLKSKNKKDDLKEYKEQSEELAKYKKLDKMKEGARYIVKPSNDRKGKTHVVISPNGDKQYFGDRNLGQHPKDEKRKEAFWARHKKNLDNNPAFKAFANATWKKDGTKELIKREDGSYSQRGLWDNIRDNKGSGNKPTKQMLEQEKKISKKQFGSKMIKYKNGSNSLSSLGQYAKGSKLIETEGREPVFSPKGKDGKRKLLYFNPNEPTHEKGGVKAMVVPKNKIDVNTAIENNSKSKLKLFPEGSSIVTANKGKNKEALQAYQKGDFKTLNKVISKMPEDKNPKKFQDGAIKAKIAARKNILLKEKEQAKSDSLSNVNKREQARQVYLKATNPAQKAKLAKEFGFKSQEEEKMKVASTSKPSTSNKAKTEPKAEVKPVETKKPISNSSKLSIKKDKSDSLNVLKPKNLRIENNFNSKKEAEDTLNKLPKSVEAKDTTDDDLTGINKTTEYIKNRAEKDPYKEEKSKTNSLGLKDDMMDLFSGVKASAINNLIKGSKDPIKTILKTPTYELEKYIDKSDPNRKAALALAKIQQANARNVSGGNAQSYLGNANQAEADKFTNISNINNEEVQRANEVDNRNIERKNTQRNIEAEARNKETEINQMEADANESRFQTGLNEMDEAADVARTEIRQKQADTERNAYGRSINERVLKQNEEELAIQKQNAELELQKYKDSKLKQKKGNKKLIVPKMKYGTASLLPLLDKTKSFKKIEKNANKRDSSQDLSKFKKLGSNKLNIKYKS